MLHARPERACSCRVFKGALECGCVQRGPRLGAACTRPHGYRHAESCATQHAAVYAVQVRALVQRAGKGAVEEPGGSHPQCTCRVS